MNLRSREPLIFKRSVEGKIGMDLPRLDVPPAEDTRPLHLKRKDFGVFPVAASLRLFAISPVYHSGIMEWIRVCTL